MQKVSLVGADCAIPQVGNEVSSSVEPSVVGQGSARVLEIIDDNESDVTEYLDACPAGTERRDGRAEDVAANGLAGTDSTHRADKPRLSNHVSAR